MSRWEKVVAAVAAVVFVALGRGCVPPVDTEDDGDTEGALDGADGAPGTPDPGQQGPSKECLQACKEALHACADGCDWQPPDTRPLCVQGCMANYNYCARDCGWSPGGCQSINSVDCSPWWAVP